MLKIKRIASIVLNFSLNHYSLSVCLKYSNSVKYHPVSFSILHNVRCFTFEMLCLYYCKNWMHKLLILATRLIQNAHIKFIIVCVSFAGNIFWFLFLSWIANLLDTNDSLGFPSAKLIISFKVFTQKFEDI